MSRDEARMRVSPKIPPNDTPINRNGKCGSIATMRTAVERSVPSLRAMWVYIRLQAARKDVQSMRIE